MKPECLLDRAQHHAGGVDVFAVLGSEAVAIIVDLADDLDVVGGRAELERCLDHHVAGLGELVDGGQDYAVLEGATALQFQDADGVLRPVIRTWLDLLCWGLLAASGAVVASMAAAPFLDECALGWKCWIRRVEGRK